MRLLGLEWCFEEGSDPAARGFVAPGPAADATGYVWPRPYVPHFRTRLDKVVTKGAAHAACPAAQRVWIPRAGPERAE